VESTGVGGQGGTKAVVDENPESGLRLICDPFSTNSQLARERGLFGRIYYIPDKSICRGGDDDSDDNDSNDNDSNDNDSNDNDSNDNDHSKDKNHGNSGNGNSNGNGHGKNKKVDALGDSDDDGGACFKNVEEYIQKGTLVDAHMYLDRLFIQSQPFTKGIVDSNGNTIDLEGVRFYENFAVDMDAQLQLAVNESPGYYQLALISDDGALLKQVNSDGTELILVNNNGSHPTKMACAGAPIYMDHNPINIKLQQYQGSRKALTMVAMWRKWDPNNKDAISECGKGGNGKYFDSSKTPIQPKKHFYELLANGWKVLENENFVFPNQEENPCAPPEEPLLLTGFSIQVPNRNSVSGEWISNLPASSQLEIKNTATGAITLGPVNPSLSLNHYMLQLGLSPNTLYSVRAISSTPSGQTVKTDERAFRTPR